MEDRLADEPQKAVDACPELADVAQGLRSIFKKIQTVDAVPEAQDQTAGDDRRNQRGEDLRQRGDHPLQHILILLCRVFYRVLGYALDAGHRDKVIVKIRHRVADDHLKLPGLRKASLHHLHGFDLRYIRLFRIVEHESHPRHTV